MKIEILGKVTHGATLSRIEPKPGEEFEIFKMFTMQDLSKEIGQYGINVDVQNIHVGKNRCDISIVSKKNMVVIGLTSYKAFVIDDNHVGKVIPSNFACIDFDEKLINPFYFAWYFNEHHEIQKQLAIAMQGSALRALSVQMLRMLEIPLPHLELQNKIGKIHELTKRKEKALFEKNALEEKLYKYLIVNKLKEDITCQ